MEPHMPAAKPLGRIADIKRKIRVFGSRPIDHRGAEIDTDAQGRLQHSQKITGSAAEIEYARAGRNKKSHVPPILAIIGGVLAHPGVALGSHAIGMLADGALALRRLGPSTGEVGYDVHERA